MNGFAIRSLRVVNAAELTRFYFVLEDDAELFYQPKLQICG